MKFCFVKQHDSMKCGIACLQMICVYHGKIFGQEFISSVCITTTEGVSLLGIRDAAVTIGFNATCRRLNTEDLTTTVLPCILHWNQNHFVVLYKIKNGKKFYIADPAKGLITYTLDEFKVHWISTHSDGEDKGVAMFLEPTPAFYANKDFVEGNKEKRSFRFLFGYIRKYRKYFGQIILGLLAGSILQLVLP
ncbi:MAG: ABC transporter ATP-binding protein, partial [Prevotella sp.]|nr:ABC transporter ATP-binding protein [Candidatus Prevotella equi]